MTQLRSQSSHLSLTLFMIIAGAVSCPAQTVLVRHAPILNGRLEGSVQQMEAENVTLSGSGAITGDLLVPGSPTVRLSGRPVFGGTVVGTGRAAPANYRVTLNGKAFLGHLHSRIDPIKLPKVNAPPRPAGGRRVTLDKPRQSPGDFSTIRDLTLDSRAGEVAVAPGTYGNFISNGNSSFVLGQSGSSIPAIYNFQSLTLNGNGTLRIVGPVIVTLHEGLSTRSPTGSPPHPEWLKLRIASGGLSLKSHGSFYGYLEAPDGTLTINGNALLVGGAVCDRLIIKGNGRLRPVAAAITNRSPEVALTSPANGANFVFPSGITLTAAANDPDGAVVTVEFRDGAAKLGVASLPSPSVYQLQLPGGLPVGSHVITASVVDNLGSVAISAPITIIVNEPPNLQPQVTLTVPTGSIYSTSSQLSLTATAGDSDGMIVRVEFYIDSELAGTLGAQDTTSGDYNFSIPVPSGSGVHVLTARAYDDAGAFDESAPVTITVVPSLPYAANFEISEGYQPGSLSGQQGWTVSQGSAGVTTTAAFDGIRSVEMASGSDGAVIQQLLSAPLVPRVIFVDLFVQPVAGSNPADGSLFDLGAGRAAFVRDGLGGRFQALQGDDFSGGTWKPAGAQVGLDAEGRASRWIRLTARLSYPTQTWDLVMDGQLALLDLGFSGMGGLPSPFIEFLAQGAAGKSSYIDFLYAGYDNPLFADRDQDGMDDDWEIENGLDPDSNDRDGDRDGDGLSNIREYQLGTRADRGDTDGDGLPDGWEILYHFDPLMPAAQGNDADQDGLSDLEEMAAGTNPAVADSDGDGLPDGWEVSHGFNPRINDSAADADGDGISNLEEYSRGTDPKDFFDGVLPKVEALNSGGAGPSEELALIARMPDGSPWANAPVVFQITSGSRRITATLSEPNYAMTLEVRADANGLAKVFLEPLQP